MNFLSTLEKTSFPSSGQQHGSRGLVQRRRQGEYEDEGFSRQQNPQGSHWLAGHSYNIICKWEPFREQILLQWDRLTGHELDEVGPNRSKLAMLIQNKYGIASHLVENYLRNFERTLPLI